MQSSCCARTTNKGYIKRVLTHPTIWPHIKGKCATDPAEYEPPVDDDTHFLKVDGGLFILHPYKDGMKIHANMVKRGQVAIEGCGAVIAYARALGVKALYAVIPTINPNVVAFAKTMGFTEYKIEQDKHYLRLGL